MTWYLLCFGCGHRWIYDERPVRVSRIRLVPGACQCPPEVGAEVLSNAEMWKDANAAIAQGIQEGKFPTPDHPNQPDHGLA